MSDEKPSDAPTLDDEVQAVTDLFTRFVDDMKRTLPHTTATPNQMAWLLKMMIDVAATTASAFNLPPQVFIESCIQSIAKAMGAHVVVVEERPEPQITREQMAEVLRNLKGTTRVH